MKGNKPGTAAGSGSDLRRVDSHVIQPDEYDELPELTDDAFARAKFNRGGRPRLASPKVLISLRLPHEVVEGWRATGPGWQSRMAARLARRPFPRAKRTIHSS
jgi:uncharacterized protein (DUF4415 family)